MDELLDHDYDGIKEYDNDLPSWWVWLFYLGIVFAAFYLMYYHVTVLGPSSLVEYKKQVDPNYKVLPEDQGLRLTDAIFPTYRSPYYKGGREVMQADLFAASSSVAMAVLDKSNMDMDVVPVSDAGLLATGEEQYQRLCFTCHGRQGEGGIGPNLTDEYWIHGGSFPEIVHTIKKGVPLKGMVAWERELKPDVLIAVASYVETFQGTTPPNAKAPQGELYTPVAEE